MKLSPPSPPRVSSHATQGGGATANARTARCSISTSSASSMPSVMAAFSQRSAYQPRTRVAADADVRLLLQARCRVDARPAVKAVEAVWPELDLVCVWVHG